MIVEMTQICSSYAPWYTTYVASKSNPGLQYSVQIPMPGDPPEHAICSCPGYVHRSQCSHQEIAVSQVCYWIEGDSPQSDRLRAAHICPSCGEPTLDEE